MTNIRLTPVTALAVILAATSVSLTPAVAAPVSTTGSCVDGSGRTWLTKVIWGEEYSDSAGVRRVQVDYAAWTTNGRSVATDSVVRSYDGSGTRLQELQWTGAFDYNNGTSWRSRNPLNPPTAPGKVRVTVTLGVDGDGKGDCTTTFVQPSSSPPAPTPTPTGGWVSDQTRVPNGSAGCSSSSGTPTAVALTKEWDYWDACGGTEVSATAEGLPKGPWGGDHVFRWHKPAGDPSVYQKLNRTFTKDNWPNGSPGPKVPNTGSPADVSGVYTVWQYIPSARFHLNPGHGWVLPVQFKENYTDANGGFRQDPLWRVGCNNFSGPTMCSMSPHNSPKFALSSYQDRWVKWEFRVYQGAKDKTGHGGRIELYADDKLLDTGYESQFHVGSGALAPLSRTHGWVWVVGQYTSNQSTGGVPDYQRTDVTSYIGRSSVTLLPS